MKSLYIAFVWHQHQPYYKNPETGKYLLPWVRMHCTKDYYDMVAILENFPKIKQTFNLTPSLMEQIIDYTNGATDDFLEVSRKPTKELSAKDRIFILKNFFMANPSTMIEPYQRYNELYLKRGRRAGTDYLTRIEKLFSIEEIRDIVVLFNLSWVDPYFREKNEKIKNLFIKGKKFTEEDKLVLLDETAKIVSSVLDIHKKFQDKGQIEVTTTPFYHPILPLIIDTNIARVGMPHVFMPKTRFQYPQDAQIHIDKGVELYKNVFGKNPNGMWPSEGSVSPAIVPMVAKHGIKWIATDEEILFKTLVNTNPVYDVLYKPYTINIGGSKVNIVFRDHELSDLIGFVYNKMHPEDAANDFIRRLYEIKNSASDTNNGNHSETGLVSIILDGENCWEYYKNDGLDFLNTLYSKLSNEEKNGLITTTVSEYLDKFPPNEETELKDIFPGSWINGNFGIWLGHPEDNQAWDYLNTTRKFLASKTPKDNIPKNIQDAWNEIYIAEGSDWNWWYGSDHSSMNDTEFDQLFRSHLINVYKLLNEKVPDNLYLSIKKRWDTAKFINPIDFIKPKIDGKVSNYFEWHNAGFYDIVHSGGGGAMHQTDTCLKAIYWGFDESNLYFRLDCAYPYPEDTKLKIIFLKPDNKKFIELDPNNNTASFNTAKLESFMAGKGGIIEFSLPFAQIGTKTGDSIEFIATAEQKDIELERWPGSFSITLKHPDKYFSEEYWSA
ncbi:MAG: alpha-amylase/alpha-mannosidase [Elusimicrobia bacterium]|nr:alpha-amylase/alpha-mannosidase [Elusimicrobiota bacterium]